MSWRFPGTRAGVEVTVGRAMADRGINIVVDGPGARWRGGGEQEGRVHWSRVTDSV